METEPLIVIPEAFATSIITRFGQTGRRWLESLPRQVNDVCAMWQLEVEGPTMHGEWGVVIAVRGAEKPAVLKLTWPDEDNPLKRVVTALSLWDGRGAVRLLRVDSARQALLLERLDAAATLENVAVGEALGVAGRLLRRLAVPAPTDFPSLEAVARRIAATLPERWERHGRPMPWRVVERAVDLALELTPSARSLIVNWDVHYSNVLRAEREAWLAIDPQMVAGDVEYGAAQLLWWRLEDIEVQGGVSWALDILIASAELDAERTKAWAYVRTLDYWLFGLGAGLTIDPPRCGRVIKALDLMV